MTAIEAISSMYAEGLLERFRQIRSSVDRAQVSVEDISEPLIGSLSAGHQNISGHLYRGTNSVFLPIAASMAGRRMPVWMSRGQMSDMGVGCLPGARSVPVIFCEPYVRDTETGRRSPVTIAEYDAMQPGERTARHLAKAFTTPVYHRVFNIEDTTFAEAYPRAMDEIRRTLGIDERPFRSAVLDSVVSGGAWQCPVETVPGADAGYDRDADVIRIRPMGEYGSASAYYSDLLRGMARSTGSEMRMDRDIWSQLPGDRLHESLVTEISAASMGCLVGLPATMSPWSLDRISEYISLVDGDRRFVYGAVRAAAAATRYMEDALGLQLSAGVDVGEVLRRHYPANGERMERRHSERADAHHAGRDFTPRSGRPSRRHRHQH